MRAGHPGVRLRAMRREDCAGVAELLAQLGQGGVSAEAVAARYAALAERADIALTVAVDGTDRPVGMLQVLEKPTLSPPPQAAVHALVVAEAYRRAGVGGLLMDAAEAWARERGLGWVTLYTRDHRAGAQRFYEARGYTLAKTSRGYAKRLG